MKTIQDGDLYLVAAKRSAFGSYLGTLSSVDPLELAVTVGAAALDQCGGAWGAAGGTAAGVSIDGVFGGCCIPKVFPSHSTIGRQIALALGLRQFAVTIDTACCSPLTALRMAVWGLCGGEIETALIPTYALAQGEAVVIEV